MSKNLVQVGLLSGGLEITSLIPGYLAASPVVWRVLLGPVRCFVRLGVNISVLIHVVNKIAYIFLEGRKKSRSNGGIYAAMVLLRDSGLPSSAPINA